MYAASSLTSTFTELGKQFEADHKGVKVKFSFGGSSDLVAQLQQGAPADVFASADTANMDKATGDDLVEGDPVDFASNTLEIAVPPDNPAKVTDFADLAKAGTKVVVCAPEVPCGAAAQKVEQASGVDHQAGQRGAVRHRRPRQGGTGEADAGLVYVTDVKAAGDKVKGITFPESSSAVNTYPIAALADSKNTGPGAAVRRPRHRRAGQQVLADAGFAKP